MTTPAARRARRPVPRSVAAALLVLLAGALAGCGFNYQTDAVYQAAPGTNSRSGQVDVLDAVVVSATPGQGTFVASLVNNSQTKSDTLTQVTAANQSSGITASIGSPVQVGPNALVDLSKKASITVSGTPISAGGFVKLTLQFSSGQTTTLGVPVVWNQQQWASVSPSASSSGSSSPSPSPSAGSSSSSSSSSPSPSPSASATSSP